MENEKVFDTWFKVNVRPFKQALLNTVCKWGNLFKKHLVNHVINRYETIMLHVIMFCKSNLLKETLGFVHLRFSILSYYFMVSCDQFDTEWKGRKIMNSIVSNERRKYRSAGKHKLLITMRFIVVELHRTLNTRFLTGLPPKFGYSILVSSFTWSWWQIKPMFLCLLVLLH